MTKIINLFESKNDDIVTQIEVILERAKNGEFENFLFAGQMTDSKIGTAWANCDLPKRQELISHLQIDVITGVVLDNLE